MKTNSPLNKRSILFIINPISGTGKKKIVEKLVQEKLDRTDIDFKIRYTDYAGHAREIAKEVTDKGLYDTVVAVGGDGSVNEVASGLIGSKVKLGVIPTGSGNGFARHMKIPLKIKEALKTIEKGNATNCDTGIIGGYKFVGVSGVGFDAFISKKFDEASTRGFWTYFKLTVKEYRKYQERGYKISFDGNEMVLKALIISFCNSNQWGNDFVIAPSAQISDGNLKLVIVRKMPIYAVPFFALKLWRGKVDSSKYYKYFKIKEANIKQSEDLIHVDGDPVNYGSDFNVKIVPNSLLVLT